MIPINQLYNKSLHLIHVEAAIRERVIAEAKAKALDSSNQLATDEGFGTYNIPARARRLALNAYKQFELKMKVECADNSFLGKFLQKKLDGVLDKEKNYFYSYFVDELIKLMEQQESINRFIR